jgi:CDP-4-dehydro-6-deoxyglucose reductase, E3
MATVSLGDRTILLGPSETILDALLRCGMPMAHSCKAGVCQSCLLRLSSGVVADGSGLSEAQTGLNETMRAQGYFLACRMRPEPESDLSIRRPDAEECSYPAKIARLTLLSQSVLQVRLQMPRGFAFHAGQYITLLRPDGLSRSYSIANRPSPDHSIELHVRRVINGQMSGWLFDRALVGDSMWVRGPAGSCFYLPPVSNDDDPGDGPRPILLAGSGTGLAPLYGILQDALVAGHRAPLWLFHGAKDQRGFYLQNELLGLARVFPHLRYVAEAESPLAEAVGRSLPDLSGFKAYLCGDPATVAALQEHVFLAGVASADIFSDAFLPAAR